MEQVLFDVGPVSTAAARLLAAGTGAYALLTAAYAFRGFQARLQDRWAAAASAFVMGALATVLWLAGARLVPAPFSIFLLLVFLGSIIFTLTYTLGRYKERIEKFKDEAGARLQALLKENLPEDRYAAWLHLRDRFTLGHEERRKMPHLMMGIFIAIYLALGWLILRPTWDLLYGGDSMAAGEGIENFYAASHSGWLVAGHMLAVTCLLAVLYVITPTELLRLRFPELSYPMKDIILTRLREREKGLFGAHYYIAGAAPLAALWLTSNATDWERGIPAVMAVLAVTVFADSASALVGIRWGKRKWFHHPGKTYLGTLGGAAVAIAVALPFVGIPMAIVSGLVFALLDILAPVPIPISDNILNPVGLSLAYLVGWSALAPMIPFY